VEAPVAKIVTQFWNMLLNRELLMFILNHKRTMCELDIELTVFLEEKYLLPRNVSDAVVSRIKNSVRFKD